MLGFDLTGTNASIAMLVIVTITFIQFIREKQPPEVVAIGSAATMLVLGLLPPDDAAGVLSNSAPNWLLPGPGGWDRMSRSSARAGLPTAMPVPWRRRG